MKRVLIIDDDPDFSDAVTSVLESAGLEVKRAASGQEGLDAARSRRPDLVLLDVMMKERTEGFFTLQEIRRNPALAPIPVIVISSIYSDHPHFSVRPESSWLPADLFLPKPIDPAHLLEAVKRLLEAPGRGPASTDEGE